MQLSCHGLVTYRLGWARHRVTSLMQPTTLPLNQTANCQDVIWGWDNLKFKYLT